MSEPRMKSDERLVVLGGSFDGSAEVIACLAGLAKDGGFVEDLFIRKVQERETEFPTGLAMPVPLAIPHISDGCIVPFVSIATLASPVVFKSMDLSGDDVFARIVFLFGILDPKSQVAVLQKFARTFANGGNVEKLLGSCTPGALLRELNDILDGLLDVG
ncbi:MAG: PTS sugar transporter subunit IIA [Synergistaceae bacterium]|jgi:PTS system galactitol-specific IIA component|nr:PTS sugar transporter subunit IIA [Synergistaceae bacterium]